MKLFNKLFISILIVALIGGGVSFATNYTMTQGAGTTFGSIVVSAVNYAQQLLCDPTTPSQCAAISAGGAVKVDASATTQPVSAASLPLPTGAATSANQSTEITALNSIVTNTGAAIPAGTALIGKVGIDQTTPGTTNGVAIVGVNGATALAGNGTTGTGSPRVTISSDNSAVAGLGAVATGAAPPTNAIYLGVNASGATGGHIAGLISCDSHVFKHITSATDTLAVQGVASQTIYVCSWRSRAAGVATWFLENTASANANCSSSNTQITGVATEAANTGETWGTNFWSGLKNTSGNGLCINSTGSGGVDVDIWYTQF